MSFTGARMAIWACWSRNPERAWRLVTSACNRTAYRPGRAIVPVFLCPAVRGRRGVFLRNAGAFDRARGVRFSFCVTRDSCARRAGGVVFPAERGFLCPSADGRGVLFHSRERTKGRPGTANLSQHHGCPRIPPRLAWGRNLLLREAVGFSRGRLGTALGVMPVVRWRPGARWLPASCAGLWA